MSIGGDAVEAAEQYYRNGSQGDGTTSIEQISKVYGKQAVVVSIDPRRVWVKDPASCKHHTVRVTDGSRGPGGEEYCWWQCTIKGGREGRDIGETSGVLRSPLAAALLCLGLYGLEESPRSALSVGSIRAPNLWTEWSLVP